MSVQPHSSNRAVSIAEGWGTGEHHGSYGPPAARIDGVLRIELPPERIYRIVGQLSPEQGLHIVPGPSLGVAKFFMSLFDAW